MIDGVLPPFGPAPGPAASDAEVLAAYAEGGSPRHSSRLHIEDAVLYIGGESILAIRLDSDTVLVRVDLPVLEQGVRALLEGALDAAGLSRLDERTLLGVPVALQLVGLRLSEWDLWGTDIDRAFACLRQVAVGDW